MRNAKLAIGGATTATFILGVLVAAGLDSNDRSSALNLSATVTPSLPICEASADLNLYPQNYSLQAYPHGDYLITFGLNKLLLRPGFSTLDEIEGFLISSLMRFDVGLDIQTHVGIKETDKTVTYSVIRMNTQSGEYECMPLFEIQYVEKVLERVMPQGES